MSSRPLSSPYRISCVRDVYKTHTYVIGKKCEKILFLLCVMCTVYIELTIEIGPNNRKIHFFWCYSVNWVISHITIADWLNNIIEDIRYQWNHIGPDVPQKELPILAFACLLFVCLLWACVVFVPSHCYFCYACHKSE